MITIKNARIVLEDKAIDGFVTINGDRIIAVGEGNPSPSDESSVIDASNSLVVPGFVDLHTHGAGGRDYMDGEAEDIIVAAQSELRHGTTTVLPTTLTSSDDDLFLFLRNFRKVRESSELLPDMPGVHLEGPYFDMVEKGAQDARYITVPKKEHYMSIIDEADGCIKRWSLAPELPGSIQMLDDLKDQGILFSAAHTAATYDDVSRAYDHGLSLLTHFYSGMSSIVRKGGFRILGVVESGYLIDKLNVELICDGLHLPPDLLRLIMKCKDHRYITACTDSMRGAGMGNGPSILGPKGNGQAVIIEDGIAKMPDRTCFAGSVATGNRLFRTLYKIMGLPAYEASWMTSLHPAQLIGLGDETGSIQVGKRADLVILDEECNIKHVFAAGKAAV